MKSLLAQALTVIERVRSLELVPSASMPNVYRLGCEVRRTPLLLRELALALDDFDAASRVGRDPTRVLALTIRYAGEHGINVREMAEYVRGQLPGTPIDASTADVDPEHVPLPGQIGAPPPRGEETVDQANIRTRTGGVEPAAKYTAEALPGADLVLSEAAERMGEVARAIGPERRDHSRREDADHHGHQPARSADRRPPPEGTALMAEFKALEVRLGFLLENCGGEHPDRASARGADGGRRGRPRDGVRSRGGAAHRGGDAHHGDAGVQRDRRHGGRAGARARCGRAEDDVTDCGFPVRGG